jgi:hypothetical protein
MGTYGVMSELVFRTEPPAAPGLEVRVNFGVFAGRNATQAEIDDLARALHAEIDSFAIIAEERHEFDGEVEAAVRQIVIEVTQERAGLEQRVLEIAQQWATDCIHSRSDLGELGSEL